MHFTSIPRSNMNANSSLRTRLEAVSEDQTESPYASSSAAEPLSPQFVAISTLADAQPYQPPPQEIVRHTARGTLLPPIARRRQFPRGQRRFRDRLQSLEERLQLDVNGLQQEIRDLYVRQNLVANLHAQEQLAPSTDSMLQRVVDYFKIFSRGYLPSQPCPWLQQQDDFIDIALDSKLDYGPANTMHNELGLTIFREQWHRYTQWHATITFELESLHVQQSSRTFMVIAHGATTVQINEVTLQALFPTVLKDPELVQRMLGTTVKYPNRITFYFAPNGQITKIIADLDFLTGLQQAVGSLKLVARILGSARIMEEQSYIGGDEDVRSPSDRKRARHTVHESAAV